MSSVPLCGFQHKKRGGGDWAHVEYNSLSLVQLKDTHAKAMSSAAASAESKLAAAMAEKDIIDAQVSHTCQCG